MDIIDRLHEIANAIADANYSELTMRIPAEPDRDADLVVSSAAREIARLRSELAEYRQKNALLREALDDAAERMDRARGIIRTPHGVGWALLAEANDQLRAELAECKQRAVRIYNSGYHAGHHDTVEGCYTHILPCDMSTYHDDIVAKLAAEGDAK